MIVVYGLVYLLLLLYSLLTVTGLTVMMHWHYGIMPLLTTLVTILWFGSLRKKEIFFLLLVFNAAFTVFYILLTPQEQFKNVKWETSCAVKPQAFFLDRNKVKISNVRDFRYRTAKDFDIKYQDVICNIDKLESLDLGVSHWDGMDFIAHVMLCFNFSDREPLVLSVEMRCPEGSSRDVYTTFLKQHELIYIWGTANDLFDLRSTYRDNEAIYRYRTAATADEVKILFTQLLKRTRELNEKPEFYRIIKGNCTTELLPALQKMRPSLKWDLRVLINGTIDRMFFEQGFIVGKPGERFEPLRARSIVPIKSGK